ncbi:hypothetical protein OAX78_00520 [Planctomycetota bacterium]|nr:hypothetical protein [Planctomycetota bacterium]
MPTDQFLVKLKTPRGEPRNEKTKYGLRVTAPRRVPEGYRGDIPYHAASAGTPPGDCFLQIWELDFFSGGRYLSKEETDTNERQNQLLATIPGAVVRQGRTWHFRPTGGVDCPTAFDELNGKITLKLTDASGSEQEYEINMPEYEAVFEIAVCIRIDAADTSFGELQDSSSLLQVRNLEASLRRQLDERGGFSAAFVCDYDTGANRERGTPKTTKQIKDSEFSGQAEQMIATVPTFKIVDGELRLGYYKISGRDEIQQPLGEIANAIMSELNLAEAPKCTGLFLYGHGGRTTIQLNPGSWSPNAGSLKTTVAQSFVDEVKDYVGDNLVVALFACSCGRGERASSGGGSGRSSGNDASYGKPLPGEIPGADSLGYVLHKAFQKAAIYNTVWAHTTAAHTTRNPRLRVFSSWGITDIANLLIADRNLPSGTVTATINPFRYGGNRARLSNANKIRTLSCQSALYFDWSWNGGTTPDTSDPAFSGATKTAVDQVLSDLMGLVEVQDTGTEPFTYEGGHRGFLTGKADGAPEDPQLSKNFRWGDVKNLTPLRVNLPLLAAVQIARSRSRRAITLRQVWEDGYGLVGSASASHLDTILAKAEQLVEEGELSAAFKHENRIWFSRSGVEYSDDMAYITGLKDGFAADPKVSTHLSYSSLESAGGPRCARALLNAAEEIMAALDITFGISSIADNGDTLTLGDSSPEVVRAAQQLAGAGMIGSANGATISMNS